MGYRFIIVSIPDTAAIFAPFFDSRSWQPFGFQREVWQAHSEGKSGLLHAPTGQGKTLAVWLGPLAKSINAINLKKPPKNRPFSILWITPLRALAADTLRALKEPLENLGLEWEVASRTGDTPANQRAKLRKQLPFALITTPESLSLMLTYDDFREKVANLDTVIIDEWHELLGTKRGVQTELCLSKLRNWLPQLKTWGLSATLGNLEEAASVLLGADSQKAALIAGKADKTTTIETIIPSDIERFPWSGHLGTKSTKAVIAEIEKARSTLLFTNTRSQTEIWFQSLVDAKPEWKDQLAMHHGSIDRAERNRVEQGLRNGDLRCVVCTSSLDLGVDFSPVEQVIQVGSPKGIARLMQRAGRSGHQPGAKSKLLCVPTNALELVEFAAVREAMEKYEIESRRPLAKPLDVLVQHLATLAIGCGVHPEHTLNEEVHKTHAYANLTDAEWAWALRFISTGGEALKAYPQFQRATLDHDGLYRITDKRLIQQHRMSIGTITSDANIAVKFQNGQKLGTVEEGFLSRIAKGGQFIFSGRRLQLIRLRDQTATVKVATSKAKGQIATWVGTKMPLSSELSHAVARRLVDPSPAEPEMRAVAPILKIQSEWSQLPTNKFLLIEQTRDRDGELAFIYPFAGRLVHEGIGSLVGYRISKESGEDVHVTMNDYGFGLSSRGGLLQDEPKWRELLSTDQLLEDLLACMNTAELAKRQFRGVAQVAGLVLQGFPGKRKTTRDLQISSSLLFEVFTRYDPENLLLAQAQREIFERQLELSRLRATLTDLEKRPLALENPERLTPMAFPLWADRLTATLPAGDYQSRLESMLTELESAAV